jgi:polysaccharide deacetylase family protein (PEP-CTERM system associated)
MSIDVEEWFQVENLRRVVSRDSWDGHERRLELTIDRMLSVLDEHGVRATFFVLGWTAERSPQLVRAIASSGHEVASHGYGHELLHGLDEAAFRDDVTRSKDVLEDLVGQPVEGYRAPSFSITDWALPILREVGYHYDSSAFPISFRHSRYGTLGGDIAPIAMRSGITEVSLSCLRIAGQALPWSGGGYFRLVPYPLFRWGVRRILGSSPPYVFYIHPWEFDHEQPRLLGLKRSERLRHYLNLERTEARWTALLRDFRWLTIRELIARHQPADTPAGIDTWTGEAGMIACP